GLRSRLLAGLWALRSHHRADTREPRLGESRTGLRPLLAPGAWGALAGGLLRVSDRWVADPLAQLRGAARHGLKPADVAALAPPRPGDLQDRLLAPAPLQRRKARRPGRHGTGLGRATRARDDRAERP